MNTKVFFTGFGFALLLLVVAGGAYFLGIKRQNVTPKKQVATDVTGEIPESLADFTPAPPQDKGVSAGGAVSFPKYTIVVPPDWIATGKHDNINDLDELTIFKGEYEIRIFQAATGGALCLYPGDAPFEGPSATYAVFSEINGQNNLVFRRGGDAGANAFTLCELKNDGSYFAPTMFGHISFSLPAGYDADILAEMDAIISSIIAQ